MAYNITDACVKCGSCAEQCPVEAISEGEDKYVIDPDVCVSCGSCAVPRRSNRGSLILPNSGRPALHLAGAGRF